MYSVFDLLGNLLPTGGHDPSIGVNEAKPFSGGWDTTAATLEEFTSAQAAS